MENKLISVKKDLINQIQDRLNENIIEPTNADLLINK